MAICMYCEKRVDPYSPNVIRWRHDPDGGAAHRHCMEEAELRQHKRDAQSEIMRLRERVRELERQLAPSLTRRTVDPHDPNGGEDDVHCPNGGRLIR